MLIVRFDLYSINEIAYKLKIALLDMIIWRMFCRPIHFSELVIHFFSISIQNFFLALCFSFLDETIEITGIAAVDFVEVSFRKSSKVGPVDLVQVTLLSAKAHSSA